MFSKRPPSKNGNTNSKSKSNEHKISSMTLTSSSSVSTSNSLSLSKSFFHYDMVVIHPSVIQDVLLVFSLSFSFPRGYGSESTVTVDCLSRKWPCFGLFIDKQPFHSCLKDRISKLSRSLLDQMSTNFYIKFGNFIGEFPFTLDMEKSTDTTLKDISPTILAISSDAVNGASMVQLAKNGQDVLDVHIGREAPPDWGDGSSVKVSKLRVLPPTISL
ncbi:hypothetical protein P9112_001253 [Eukaryota sp. TZLM1-RC]